jgi:hypothetical protein
MTTSKFLNTLVALYADDISKDVRDKSIDVIESELQHDFKCRKDAYNKT